MALNAYLTIKGQKTGIVKGSVTQKGREDSIMAVAADHTIVSPRDPQSGLPAGQRQHKPFVFTKELDKSTPVLYNILATNENLSEVIIRFWEANVKAIAGVGSEVQDFTIKLTNANIMSIHFHMGNNLLPAESRIPPLEEIALTYQKIEWTWNDGGITAGDDWEVMV